MSNGEVSNLAIAPNAKRLLSAGFLAILAAGVGAAIRGGILDNWGREFGFTGAELGTITGAGVTGFCFGIIIGGVVCDKIGYGKLVVAAFAMHALSAFIPFAPGPEMAKATVYNYLFWGTFIFAVANGTLEAVANPLVATLFPQNRTHFLNILHASWPAGLVLGSALGWVLDDKLHWSWKLQLALFLIPTVLYGIMFFGQHFPKSEASQQGRWLFIWTSAIMFGLRFCADFIEKKLGFSPVAILLTCAILACVGLNLASGITSFTIAVLALGVYAVGKTFFWPTMLAVASDRFPRTGAVAISIMDGIGMMSAGLIGAPGLGYFKDRYAGEELQTVNASLYGEFKAEKPSQFLLFSPATGLDGKKLGA